jgi:hypothetical protein
MTMLLSLPDGRTIRRLTDLGHIAVQGGVYEITPLRDLSSLKSSIVP